MNCNEINEILIDYFDNNLDITISNSIKTHIENCSFCKKNYEETKMLLSKMNESKLQIPSDSLKNNFNKMLEKEIRKNKNIRKVKISFYSPMMQIAAGIAILITGMLIGIKIASMNSSNPNNEISGLRNEVKEMKEVLMFSMLKNESASERIKAVSYSEEIKNPDRKVIEALLFTLNNDKNENVRLAAAYSLARFSDIQSVRDSLIESLNKQTEPVVQIALINLLVEIKEVKAVETLKKLINNQNSLKEVKEQAQQGLKRII